jgi:hypothetical protein
MQRLQWKHFSPLIFRILLLVLHGTASGPQLQCKRFLYADACYPNLRMCRPNLALLSQVARVTCLDKR